MLAQILQNKTPIVVYNPASGFSKNGLLEGLNFRLKKCGLNHWPLIQTTPDVLWVDEFKRELAHQPNAVIFCLGGDGTAMSIASAILQSGSQASLFIIPSGRGNDFVRAFYGYTKSQSQFWDWFDQSTNWKITAIDVAQSTSKFFINMASLGYGGEVVEKAVGRKAFWSNWGSVYKIEGTIAYFKYPETECNLEVDGKTVYEGKFFGAFIGNGQANASGLFWTPTAIFDDGKLNAFVFKKPDFFKMLKGTYEAKEGQQPSFDGHHCLGSELKFTFNQPVPLELDGDFIGSATQFHFSVFPQSLRVWKFFPGA